MPENLQTWSAADLLDFEYFLNAESSDPDRDRVFASEKLAPEFGEAFRPDAKPQVRRAVFRRWLERRREDSEEPAFSPGESFQHSCRVIGAVIAVLAAMAGASLIFGLLHFERRYFNVLLFLAVTLLPQLLLLIFLFGGWIFRGSISRSRTMGFVQTLTQSAIDWLSQKAWANRLGKKASASWQSIRRRPYLVWPVTSITQSAGVLFNAGLIAGFVGCLLVMDVRFFWESTPAVAAAESLQTLTRFLAAPWSWAAPGLVPSLAEIQGSNIELTGGEAGLSETIDTAKAWAPFLIATILTWGLLPRLLLRLTTGWMGKRAVRSYTFNERRHRELWRRLTDLHVETRIEGPGDDAAAICWGGLNPETVELRRACLQQLRLNPAEVLDAGGADPDGDGLAIEQLTAFLEKNRNVSRVILLADAWGLAPRDLGPFLKRLREKIGSEVSIVALLVGVPEGKGGTAFTGPESKDVAVWEEFAAALGDPQLTIHPFRSNRVDSANQQG